MGVGSRSADMSHTQSAVQPTNHFVKALAGGVFAAFWFCFVVVVDMRFGGGWWVLFCTFLPRSTFKLLFKT